MARYFSRTTDIQQYALLAGIRPTGTAIAEAVGIHPTAVNRMFAGRPPSASTMAALVAFFGVSTEDLFELVGDESDLVAVSS